MPNTNNTTPTGTDNANVEQAVPVGIAGRMEHAKPQRRMLRTISWIGEKTVGMRAKRWDKYKVGQTLYELRLRDGVDHKDVLWYVDHKLMKLAECTDEAYEKALAAWKRRMAKAAKAETTS